jgi:hypothetical protein
MRAEFVMEVLGRFPIQACSINLSARFNDYLKKDQARPSVFLYERTKQGRGRAFLLLHIGPPGKPIAPEDVKNVYLWGIEA